MSQAHMLLFDEISRLPFDKLGKVLLFIRYLNKEDETELILTKDEQEEFYNRLNSDDFIMSDELAEKINALPSRRA